MNKEQIAQLKEDIKTLTQEIEYKKKELRKINIPSEEEAKYFDEINF
jgi:hypothetical protein